METAEPGREGGEREQAESLASEAGRLVRGAVTRGRAGLHRLQLGPGGRGGSSLGARLRSTLSFDVSGGGATSLFGGATDPGRGSLEVALHARLPLLVRSGLQLDYTAGVVPVAVAFGTRVSGAGLPDGTLRTETVFGAGVDGIGLVAHLGRSDRWQPYVSAVGGVRLFERPVPDPRGIRFNFSADLGAGVAFRVAPAHRVAVGVVLHHLSNGGLGSANPSFNGFDVTVSVGRWYDGGSRRGH